MKTMNEQDKNQMLQAIIAEGESFQAKMWGVLMVDTKTLLLLSAMSANTMLAGGLGALSNEYCYVGVTKKAIYFVVIGSINVSKVKKQFRVGLEEIKKAKVKKSIFPGRRVITMKLEKGSLKLSLVNHTVGSDLQMQKEGADYLCETLDK